MDNRKQTFTRKQVRALLKRQLKAVSNSMGRMEISKPLAHGLYAKEYGEELDAIAKRIRKVSIIKF